LANRHIYLLPGLGFDTRIFSKLQFENCTSYDLNWIEPFSSEPIKDYAVRMAASIADKADKLILIGHSFGGILAQEIAAIRQVDQIFLISSIRSRSELPFHFKLMAPTFLYLLFTQKLVQKTIQFWGESHGYAKGAEQELVTDMVGQYSDKYLQWALKALSNWTGANVPTSMQICQIHGAKDKTFPVSLIKKADYILSDGDHFMVYKKAKAVKSFIQKEMI
jgi:pimeloyl-ACP methyl ester carboxylesterase